MAQIHIRIDDDTKQKAEAILGEIGMSVPTAINVFLKAVAREGKIPFDLKASSFYTKENFNEMGKE